MNEERRERLKALGEELRARREEMGLSLDDVVQATKIRRAYLESIEAGDDSISVGKVYFRAFVKSYAAFLGLDPLEYSRRYAQIAIEGEGPGEPSLAGEETYRDGKAPAARLQRPAEAPREARSGRDARRPTNRKRLPALVLCIVLFVTAGIVAARSSGLFTGAPQPRPESGGPMPEPPPQTGTSTSGSPSGSSSGQAGGDQGAPAGGTPASQPEPELEITKKKIDGDTIEFQVKADSLVVIVRTLTVEDGRCWIRATCDGKVVFEETLQAGSEKRFEASRQVSLRLGKPWVVTLKVNDKDLGQAGPFGPVLNIVFKAAGKS